MERIVAKPAPFVVAIGRPACTMFSGEFTRLAAGLVPIMSGLTEADKENGDEEIEENDEDTLIVDASGHFKCASCSIQFESRSEQVDHFRCSWHDKNVGRKQKGYSVLTEEEFDDAESSESEDDSVSDECLKGDVLSSANLSSPFHYYTMSGNVYAIHKCILNSNKPLVDQSVCSKWLIILMAGGRFAAAIFNRGELLLHKALQRYTVRAKQGGSQGAKDGSQQSKAKSAGANLRRYNEAALAKDIESLLGEWSGHIDSCSHVFLRCSAYRRSLFVGGFFDKKDPRLFSIPFVTRKPTFEEVKSVHFRLSSVIFLGDEKTFLQSLPSKPASQQNVKSSSSLNVQKQSQIKKSPKRGEKEESPPKKVPEYEIHEPAPQLLHREWQPLYTAVQLDKTEDVYQLYSKYKTLGDSDFQDFLASLNSVICRGKQDGTLLHMAAQNGQDKMVATLLRAQADPTIKNCKGNVPFQEALNKVVRKEFVNYRAEVGDGGVMDWNKAQIPEPIDPELEAQRARKLAEKKKKERHAKKVRMQAENELKAEARKEEAEKSRFLTLSDREKRALAAERRLVAMKIDEGDSAPVLARCFQCATDITAKTPFEYASNRFCSIACVKTHRSTK